MNSEIIRTELFSELHRPDSSGLPKYRRLSNTLIEAIKLGIWAPGDRLPAEEELTEMTPFSLGTVQRALRALTEDGLVVRRQGHGNFVASQQHRLEDPWHCRFLDEATGEILPIYSKAIQRVLVPEPGPWNKYLAAPSDNIMRLDRIINVNHEFKIFSRFYADNNVLKQLWDTPLEHLDGANFKKVITRQAGLPIITIDRSVRMKRIDAHAAQLIDVEPRAITLFMQAIAHVGRELCIYYQEFYIPHNERSLQFPDQAARSFSR